MKTKLLAVIMVFTMVFTVFCNIPVKAANGPSDTYAFIVFGNMEDYKEIYSEGEIYNDAMEGVTYDKDTNTLTLDNVNTNLALDINKMGDDFKLKLIGENSIALLDIYGDDYGGNLTITGDGSLTVDTSKYGFTIPEGSDEEMNAISFYAENTNAKFTVEDTATVNIKAHSYVIKFSDTPNNDASKAIDLKNGQDISSNVQTEQYYYTRPVEANCIMFEDEGEPEIFKIYTKDGKRYGVQESGESSYSLRYAPIEYSEVADRYFFDPKYNGDWNVILEEADLTARGLVATEQVVTIQGYASAWEYSLQKDKDGINHVSNYNYSEQGEIENYKVYDISDEEITLSDGETYKVLVLNEEIGEGQLTYETTKVYTDNYNIFVDLHTLNIPAGKVEEPVEEKPEENVVIKVEAADDTEEDILAKEEVGKLIEAIVNEDEGTVEGIDAELADKIREKVENGETIYVEVVAKEVKAEDIEEDAKAIEEKVKDGKIATYFDIDIVIKTATETLGTVTSLQDKIELTLDIPENLPAVESGYTRTYKVVRIHDGKVEELETTVSGKKATFKSDLFSTYALTYEDTKTTKNPATGDKIGLYFAMLAVSIVGAVVTLISMKKQYE